MFVRLVFIVLLVSSLGRATAAAEPLEVAQRQFEAGRYRQAIGTLQTAVQENGGSHELQYWLGRAYFELRENNAAAAAFERAVQQQPESSEYRLWLGRSVGRQAREGNIFARFGLARRALREFETAVRLDPRNLPAHRDLIRYYFKAPAIVGGGDDKAFAAAQKLFKLDEVQGRLALAEYWEDQGLHARAEAEYRAVLKLQPASAEPYFEAAKYFESRGDTGGIGDTLQVVQARGLTDPRAGYYRGVALILSGRDSAQARELLQQYIRSVPPRSGFPAHSAAQKWLDTLKKRKDA